MDGDLDIARGPDIQGQCRTVRARSRLWMNDGSGTFVDAQLPPHPLWPRGRAMLAAPKWKRKYIREPGKHDARDR